MYRAVPLLAGVVAGLMSQVQAGAAAPTSASDLAGNWVVDLSAKPGEPYTRPMRLDLRADGTVGGLFYQSPIEAGRWKTDRGRTCASFRTSDLKGPYQTSACATGGVVQGQTWSEARNFLFNWNAQRAAGGE